MRSLTPSVCRELPWAHNECFYEENDRDKTRRVGKDAGDVEELKKSVQLETHAAGKPEKLDHEHNLPDNGQT
jgi:hypothetical protein